MLGTYLYLLSYKIKDKISLNIAFIHYAENHTKIYSSEITIIYYSLVMQKVI